MGDSPYQDISFVEFDLSGIATLLNDLDPTKSSGPDRIPTKLLKVLATEVSPCLQLLFSASLNQYAVPSEWKKALIYPLFKKGNRRDPSNYQPVSLTSVCSKVMEHIIYSNIMSHIESNNILSDMQFGFQKRRSAELQLLQTIHDLAYTKINQKAKQT